MKSVIYTLLFQIISIIIFGFVYWKFSENFTSNIVKDSKYKIEILDCFYTSVTVQSGVGYSILNAKTDTGKIILMLQQFIMISSNVIMLYFFSLHLLANHSKYHK
jgi:type IV secretory pathway TraG/TraD family ATPase VirD4